MERVKVFAVNLSYHFANSSYQIHLSEFLLLSCKFILSCEFVLSSKYMLSVNDPEIYRSI